MSPSQNGFMSNNLRNSRNMGLTIEKYLHEIGVFSLADLAEMTSVRAFMKIRWNHPEKTIPVCYYLYSLEGALLDLHWNNLPAELKAELKHIGNANTAIRTVLVRCHEFSDTLGNVCFS